MRLNKEINNSSKNIRQNITKLTYGRGRKGAHVAPALSMTEIIAVLFTEIMDFSKDVFILSKGHGGLAYYCGLKEAGIITQEQLETFDVDGGDFPGQPSKNLDLSIVFSSGSLGMGLSYAVGRALAFQKQKSDSKAYVLIGDGESNEGSIWESAMLASQLKLDNLVAIVDWNGMQSDGKSEEIIYMNMEQIWKAYGWNVVVCDGHNEEALFQALQTFKVDTPTVVLAKTVKGKGVSFMENDRAWHHGYLTDEQYEQAIKEVRDGVQ